MPVRRVRRVLVAAIVATIATAAVVTAPSSVGAPAPPDPPPVRHPAAKLQPDLRLAPKLCMGSGPHSTCRRYAGLIRVFGRSERPTGVGATFSVHNPAQVRRNEHSLAEISIHQAGAYGNIIEVGWWRHRGVTRLFVFRWNHNRPSCYDRCGFRQRGPGKQPGVRLRPGTSIQLGWRHHHQRWNLYVNGKWSGFYPDRLWHGSFHEVGAAQWFGEVTFRRNGVGRCIDMGNGHAPSGQSARVSDIRFVNTTASYRGGRPNVTAPSLYGYQRTSPRSFKYGGPGPC